MNKVLYLQDNYDLFKEHEREQERWLRKRPLCSYCDEHIADEFAYNINGEWVCEVCMERHFRQLVPEE